MDDLMKTTSAAVYNQFTVVNNALRARILETTCARDQLRSALKKVSLELCDMEKLAKMLQDAIEDKMEPLRVAETRLMERTKRQNVELCHDGAMKALQIEVAEMHKSLQALKERLRHAQISTSRLKRSQESLKEDIAIKENSIEIDQRCLNARKTYPIQGKPGSLLSLPVSY
ncbi:unnamed protein product [Dicrocoelium dendriticum]|nr:unnamed protein product [Dicrocoelium dendriticum]